MQGKEMRQDAMNVYRQYAVIALSGVLSLSLLYLLVPWLRKPLVREDNLLELLSAGLFLVTVAAGIHLVRRLQDRYDKKVYLVIPLLGLIGFLEEMSFGERLFHFEVPVMYGVRIDAVHDLINVLYAVAKTETAPVWLIFLGVGLGFFIVYVLIAYHLYDYRVLARILNRYPPLGFVGLCGGLLVVAVLIDLEAVPYHFLNFVEELFETMAALALVFACVALKRHAMVTP